MSFLTMRVESGRRLSAWGSFRSSYGRACCPSSITCRLCPAAGSRLAVEQLGVEKVTAFLPSPETDQQNQVSSRNVRLSAINSFFRYFGGRYPQHLEQAQRILSIPFKRAATRMF